MRYAELLERRLGDWGAYCARRRGRVLIFTFLITLLTLPPAYRALSNLDVNLFNQASDKLQRVRLMRELAEDFGGDLLAGVVQIPGGASDEQVKELKAFGVLLSAELAKVGTLPDDLAGMPAEIQSEIQSKNFGADADADSPQSEAAGPATPSVSPPYKGGENGKTPSVSPPYKGGEKGPPWLRHVECRTGQGMEQALKRISRQYPHIVLSPRDVETLKELFAPENLSKALERAATDLEELPANSAERLRIQNDPLQMEELGKNVLHERLTQRRQTFGASDSEGYFLSPDRTMLVVLARAVLPATRLDFNRALMAAVQRAENRAITAFRTTRPALTTALKGDTFGQLAAGEKSGALSVGFTGMPAVSVENEMSLKYDLIGNVTTSFVGVLILFLVVFRLIWLAWDVTWTTAIVILWTLAIAGLTRGSISVLGGAFACILLGTGTDYAIHLHNAFHRCREVEGLSVEESLRRTMARCGPGIITASLTSALAFLGVGFTRFSGLAEFGFLAGMSILLGCVMMLLVFPALLARSRPPLYLPLFKGEKTGSPEALGLGLPTWGRLLEFPAVRAGSLIAGIVALAAGLLFIRFGPDPGPESVAGVRFDTEFGNLRSLNIQAIPLRNRLAEKFGLALADLRVVVDAGSEDQAYAGAEEVARRLQPFVEQGQLTPGGSVLDFIPSPRHQQITIDALRQFDFGAANAEFQKAATERFGERGPVFFKPFLRRLQDMQQAVNRANTLSLSNVMQGPLGHVLAPFVHFGPAGSVRLASSWFPVMVGPASLPAGTEAGPTTSPLGLPPGWYDSVAQALETPSVSPPYEGGENGKTPAVSPPYEGGENGKTPAASPPYKGGENGRSSPPAGVTIRVTAARMVGFEMKESLLRDCGWISLLVGVCVVIALYTAFRSVKTSLLAMIPLAYAYVALLFGVALCQALGWDFSLNFVNLIMFPLLLGSGIDVGIYMVYEARSARRPTISHLMADTGRSVLCCTLTTLVGFGAFFWSSYTGLISLGVAAFFGYSGALFGALIVLPALLGAMRGEEQAAPAQIPVATEEAR